MSLEPDQEETIHEGPRFTVKRGRFGDRTREWVEAPASVAVAAYDEQQIYLVRQPREAIGRADILELPAGLMDVDGEHPIDTAKRELREETGFEADAWVHATTYFSSVGFTDEQVHIFLATGLRKVGEPGAIEDERIELVTWPLDQIDGLIDGGVDAKTLVALLWLRRARADATATVD